MTSSILRSVSGVARCHTELAKLARGNRTGTRIQWCRATDDDVDRGGFEAGQLRPGWDTGREPQIGVHPRPSCRTSRTIATASGASASRLLWTRERRVARAGCSSTDQSFPAARRTVIGRSTKDRVRSGTTAASTVTWLGSQVTRADSRSSPTGSWMASRLPVRSTARVGIESCSARRLAAPVQRTVAGVARGVRSTSDPRGASRPYTRTGRCVARGDPPQVQRGRFHDSQQIRRWFAPVGHRSPRRSNVRAARAPVTGRVEFRPGSETAKTSSCAGRIPGCAPLPAVRRAASAVRQPSTRSGHQQLALDGLESVHV